MTVEFRESLPPEQVALLEAFKARLPEADDESSDLVHQEIAELNDNEIKALMKKRREAGDDAYVELTGDAEKLPAEFVFEQVQKARENGLDEDDIVVFTANTLYTTAILATPAEKGEKYDAQKERIFDAYDQIVSDLDDLAESHSDEAVSEQPLQPSQEKTDARQTEQSQKTAVPTPAEFAASAKNATEPKPVEAPSQTLEAKKFEKSVEAFGHLREEGLDTKDKVTELRTIAFEKGLYERNKDDGDDNQRYALSFEERRSEVEKLTSQYFDTMYPQAKTSTKREAEARRARRNIFTKSASHLVLLSKRNFEKAWREYQDVTSPERIDIPQEVQVEPAAELTPVSETSETQSSEEKPADTSLQESLKLVDRQGNLDNLKSLRREARQGDYDQLNAGAQASIAAALAERFYSEKYPEFNAKGTKIKRSPNHKTNFIDRYVRLLTLSDNEFNSELSNLHNDNKKEQSPDWSSATELPDIRESFAFASAPSASSDPETLSVGGFTANEQDSSAESKSSRSSKIKKALGAASLAPLALYNRASAFKAHKQHQRREKLALMTEEELKKNSRNKAFGAAVLAVAAYSLSSRFGGFDLMAGSDGTRADGRMNQTWPPLDRDYSQGGTTGPNSLGPSPELPSQAPFSEPGVTLDPKPEGPGANITPRDLGDRGGNEGGGRDTFTRNDLFDGNRGSRSLTAENQTLLNDFLKDYKVKSGDSVWKIAEKHLEAQGIKNPTVFEIDATKDQILKTTGLKANSTIYAGRTLGK